MVPIKLSTVNCTSAYSKLSTTPVDFQLYSFLHKAQIWLGIFNFDSTNLSCFCPYIKVRPVYWIQIFVFHLIFQMTHVKMVWLYKLHTNWKSLWSMMRWLDWEKFILYLTMSYELQSIYGCRAWYKQLVASTDHWLPSYSSYYRG
jgi:hypothetical protein